MLFSGQTAELHFLMRPGGPAGLAEGPHTLVDDLAMVKQTRLVAVPRIFNRAHDGLNAKNNEEGGLVKKLFDMGVDAGIERRKLRRQEWTSLVNTI
ncbi:hypothetical protein DSCA_59900 [Desulfosarcina alkanivorans]|uniref:Uncharacterized protein n=1 Tax=Desulfosarcina alkanivorans TaxID=571177 RepID=A0A5K7YUS3_9BACT|nr:hypothetical protein DSCA_59900 [Desulfosarcina alkanivorans]